MEIMIFNEYSSWQFWSNSFHMKLTCIANHRERMREEAAPRPPGYHSRLFINTAGSSQHLE